jgi:hypothetical protein
MEEEGLPKTPEILAIQEEVTRIIDEHYNGKPPLEEICANLSLRTSIVIDKIEDTIPLVTRVSSNENLNDRENNNNDNSDDISDQSAISNYTYSSSPEKVRALICVSLISDAIFGENKYSSSDENNSNNTTSTNTFIRGTERIRLLSFVGFSLDVGRFV